MYASHTLGQYQPICVAIRDIYRRPDTPVQIVVSHATDNGGVPRINEILKMDHCYEMDTGVVITRRPHRLEDRLVFQSSRG